MKKKILFESADGTIRLTEIKNKVIILETTRPVIEEIENETETM